MTAGTAATVLVVDDSRTTRRILRRALVGAGYLVVEAGDGVEGLAACRSERPDLVLLDIDMPVMDGLATLEAMKADDELRSLPVLFLTARTGGTDVAAGLVLGAQDYLRKPCDPAELTARVATALRLKAQEDALREQARALTDLSSTDPLTGLGNRRRLEHQTQRLILRAGAQAAAGLLIVDVDHFKRVNDTEGHPLGDRVLRVVADRLQVALDEPGPDGDRSLVRWGGEEFVVLAMGLTGAALVALGERLRLAVGRTPLTVDVGKRLDITVSVGCGSGTVGGMEALLSAADQALYEAKAGGRNRVVARDGT